MALENLKGNLKRNANQVLNAGLEKRVFKSNASVAASISDRNKPDADIIINESISKITQAASNGEYSIKIDTGNPHITAQVANYFSRKGYLVKCTKDNMSGAVVVCWMGSKKYIQEWYGKSFGDKQYVDLVSRIIDTMNESLGGYSRFGFGGGGMAANLKSRKTLWINPKFQTDQDALKNAEKFKQVLNKL